MIYQDKARIESEDAISILDEIMIELNVRLIHVLIGRTERVYVYRSLPWMPIGDFLVIPPPAPTLGSRKTFRIGTKFQNMLDGSVDINVGSTGILYRSMEFPDITDVEMDEAFRKLVADWLADGWYKVNHLVNPMLGQFP